MDGERDTHASLLQVPRHLLHRLLHLVRVSEDEPGGEDVLESVAPEGSVHVAILGEVLMISECREMFRSSTEPCEWPRPSRI